MGMIGTDAIEILTEVQMMDDSIYAYDPKYSEALNMAIKALEAQEPRRISREEWDEWRHIPNGKREPLYVQDSTGGWWILNPSNWLEIAFLTGEIKIWNKRPTAAGREAGKWE